MNQVSFETEYGHTAFLRIDPDHLWECAHQFYVKLSPSEELKIRMKQLQFKIADRLMETMDGMISPDKYKSFENVILTLMHSVICRNDMLNWLWKPCRAQWSRVKQYVAGQIRPCQLILDMDQLEPFGPARPTYQRTDPIVVDTINWLKTFSLWAFSLTKRRNLEHFLDGAVHLREGQASYAFFPVTLDKYPKKWVDHIRSKLVMK